MSDLKEKLMINFDPNGVAEKGKLFGLPYTEKTADLVIIPVPWEVTVSYSSGTADGPQAILDASAQVDLYQSDIQFPWKLGIWMAPISESIAKKGQDHRVIAANYINWLEDGSPISDQERFVAVPSIVDKACTEMVNWVKAESKKYLDKGSIVAILGGDHSTPLGLLQALSEKHSSFGILQIDAHADLRKAYEGFKYSHASISYNAMMLPQVTKLVQVGIRDYCLEEVEFAQAHKDRVTIFYDKEIKERRYVGETWSHICATIIEKLPKKVYISFDIDGLDPKLCPNTGTPVHGGFELDEILFLFQKLIKSGREIIGFDLNEVAPGPDGDEWDGNVGARALYRMATLTGVSQQLLGWK
jgi:agmatinase